MRKLFTGLFCAAMLLFSSVTVHAQNVQLTNTYLGGYLYEYGSSDYYFTNGFNAPSWHYYSQTRLRMFEMYKASFSYKEAEHYDIIGTDRTLRQAVENEHLVLNELYFEYFPGHTADGSNGFSALPEKLQQKWIDDNDISGWYFEIYWPKDPTAAQPSRGYAEGDSGVMDPDLYVRTILLEDFVQISNITYTDFDGTVKSSPVYRFNITPESVGVELYNYLANTRIDDAGNLSGGMFWLQFLCEGYPNEITEGIVKDLSGYFALVAGWNVVDPSAVPVPAAIFLLAPGLAGLAALRKKML